jgi:hypothetical protein
MAKIRPGNRVSPMSLRKKSETFLENELASSALEDGKHPVEPDG